MQTRSNIGATNAHRKKTAGSDFQIGRGFVDRGDPATVDWDAGDFTMDATWRVINCSGLVPVGAKAIVFTVDLQDDAINTWFQMRANGNNNTINVSTLRTAVINITVYEDMIVPCDSGRIVEYRGTNGATPTVLNVSIKNWFFNSM